VSREVGRAGTLSDVALCTENGERVRVHRALLAAYSSVFRELAASCAAAADEDLVLVLCGEVTVSELTSLRRILYEGEVWGDRAHLETVKALLLALDISIGDGRLVTTSDKLRNSVSANECTFFSIFFIH
jgi:hypothetical protein